MPVRKQPMTTLRTMSPSTDDAGTAAAPHRVAGFAAGQWTRRSVPWLGALFIAAIVAMAVFDIVRGYRAVVDDTGRELDTQARIIAEQTARSLQAVDVVLRHLSQQHRDGALAGLDGERLHQYLREQAVGLVQIDGLVLADANGTTLAASMRYPLPQPVPNVAAIDVFQKLRSDRAAGLEVGSSLRSLIDGLWAFPLGRRLETPGGEFAGVVGARGRVDYFQQFYRDIQLDPGTTTTLMHRNGTLLARHPAVESALGQHFPVFGELFAGPSRPQPARVVSPVDGIDRFGAVQSVPDYPLAVVVTRDAAMALQPWRAQALGSALRTLALGLLAALLLVVVTRQLRRLHGARESLEASKERFALAVAGSDDGIWDWDQASGQLFSSQRAREILGIPHVAPSVPEHDWFAALAIHPDDEPRRRAAFEAHLSGKAEAYEIELRLRHPDGVYRWARVRGVCVRDSTGRPQRMAGSVSDIDARKRAEEALRQSQERYVVAMTGSNEAHWVWNIVTDELYASPMLKELFGVSPDADPKTRTEFFAHMPVHPDDVHRVQRTMAEHIDGLSTRLDIEYRIIDRKTGRVRWIHTRGQCFRDEAGKALRMGGATVEVTERKRAEEALRESEERFALAVAGSNDGILDWDIVNDRMFSSPRAMRIAGSESDVTMRTRAEWMAMTDIHPDDRQRYDDDLREHLEGRTEVRDGEYRLRQPDGRYRWIRVRGMSVRDRNGRADPLGRIGERHRCAEADRAGAASIGRALSARRRRLQRGPVGLGPEDRHPVPVGARAAADGARAGRADAAAARMDRPLDLPPRRSRARAQRHLRAPARQDAAPRGRVPHAPSVGRVALVPAARAGGA